MSTPVPSERPPHGRRAIALWLLALAVAAAVIARTPFNADLSAFLPASPDARQQLLMDQLQTGAIARTLFVGIEGGDAKQRAAASRSLATALRASGRFEQVNNGDRGEQGAAPGTEWQASGEWVFRHRYLLSPAVGPERFTVEGLREGIDETLSLLGTPAGSALKPLLERDPTGETQRIVEALLPASGPRSEEGVWVGREVPRAVLLLSTRAEGGDIDGQLAAIEQVRASFVPLAAQGLELKLSGPGVFAVESRAQIQSETRHLVITGSLVMSGLLLAAFASLRALFVAAVPVITGVLCGVAAVGLAFGSVHGMTLGFGSTLIGEAVDYAIYYLIQARGAHGVAAAGPGWRRWRDTQWPTVRLGLWTSVCGFAVLMFSGFTGLAQLGLFSTAGLIGAALATRFVLPVLMPNGAAGAGLRRPLGRFTAWLLEAMARLKWPLLALGLAATALLVVRGGAAWNASLSSLSPIPRAALALDESLRGDLSAGEARTLVVAGGADAQAALRAAEEAGRRLDPLVADGTLAGYDTPARLLPSLRTQAARLASLPEAEPLRERLAEATAGGPLRAE
ncbi:MAG TPA: transporter, partial [Methylibium sp.]|uniref:MMPL family transporter n=1 Tax=Methylibium sp. TaxID=2067992 RepID=UPI002DB5DE82